MGAPFPFKRPDPVSAYLCEVPHVEGVVHLGRRGAHAADHTVVYGDGGGDEREEALLHLGHVVAVLEEATQLHLVDMLQGARRRLGQRQHAAGVCGWGLDGQLVYGHFF